jgi:hypothetical protein
MADKFMLFSENINKKKNNLLDLLNNGIINIKEYNFLNTVKDNVNITNIKKLKKILKKPELENIKSTFEQNYPITTFKISDIEEDILSTSPINLTGDQCNIISSLLHFLYGNNKMCMVHGYAGTGKTSLIIVLITYLLKKGLISSVALSAPTNKAVNVIISKFKPVMDDIKDIDKKCIDFYTIHKLLQYTTDYDMKGNMIFTKNKASIFPLYNIIIIDECSMLDEQIVGNIINEYNNLKNIKIILLGDSAQLPPVSEPESKIFKKPVNDQIQLTENIIINKYSLNQVIRSTNDSIIGLCNNVRKWMHNEIANPSISSFRGNGVYLYKKTDDIKKCKWFSKFSDDPEGIILAWTNKQVNFYNNTSRIIKNNNKKTKLNKYEIGDRLIMTDFYCLNNTNPLYTSDQVYIINILDQDIAVPEMKLEFSDSVQEMANYIHIKNVANKCIKEINKKIIKSYDIYVLNVRKGNVNYNINVLTDYGNEINTSDKKLANEKIQELIKYYQSYHKEQILQIEKNIIRHIWKIFNKTFVEPFANINYGYSTTVHKSQASSYPNVYVDVENILSNSNTLEAQKCIYTALTRVINNLHLLL